MCYLVAGILWMSGVTSHLKSPLTFFVPSLLVMILECNLSFSAFALGRERDKGKKYIILSITIYKIPLLSLFSWFSSSRYSLLVFCGMSSVCLPACFLCAWVCIFVSFWNYCLFIHLYHLFPFFSLFFSFLS